MSKSSERAIQWAKDNPEKYKENQKRYRERRKLLLTDEEREQQLKANRERSNKWRLEHPDKVRNWKREYMKRRRSIDPAFRKKLNELKKRWDQKNKEHNRLYQNNRYATIEDVRLKHSIRLHNRNMNNRLEVLYWYSNGTMKCKICGEYHYEFLAIDHVDNNGYIHRHSGELRRYSNDIAKYLIANSFPEGYQILCHNCNQIKRMELIPSKDNAWSRHRRKYRDAMLNKYSNNDIKCKYCNIRDKNCLTFHHVKGGGMKEKRELGYDSLVSYLYHNDISLSDIEVVCQNCNKSIGHYGYFPEDIVSHHI